MTEMTEELERIEKMLAEGKITPGEAERLKRALADSLQRKPEDARKDAHQARRRGPKTVIRALNWVITLGVCFGAVCMGLSFSLALPKFTPIFMAMDVQLPALTRLLVAIPPPVYLLVSVFFAAIIFVKELLLSAKRNTLLMNLGALLLLAGALFISITSLYLPMSSIVPQVEESGESEAALLLAEDGKVLLTEYQQFKRDNPTRPWNPKKLDLKKFDPEGRLELLDATVLSDDSVLIASGSGSPGSLKGYKEPGSDPSVEILRGTYTQGNSELACRQYKVVFQAGGRQGSARLIVRLED